jgi:hypothetical protein
VERTGRGGLGLEDEAMWRDEERRESKSEKSKSESSSAIEGKVQCFYEEKTRPGRVVDVDDVDVDGRNGTVRFLFLTRGHHV